MSSNEEIKDSIRHVDDWTVLKVVNEGEVNYRLLSSTNDEFFDRWQLNSGIVNFTVQHRQVDFHGYSGSVYRCKLGDEGVNPIMASVLTQWQDRFENARYAIRAIRFDMFMNEWEAHKPKWN